MATQIKVNSATGNVTIQLSRTVIGTVVTANTANYANFAGTAETANNLNAATTANVVIGGGTNGYVLSTNGAGLTSWVAQTGGGGTYGDSNVVTLMGAFGSNTITTTGLITGNGGGLSNIAGANVSGVVANATHSTISDSANSVAVANVSGIGNIATVNLDGNTANYLGGTGVWGPIAGGANANFANYAGNVTLSNQPNITQTGNLVSFTVDDAVANSTTHQIDPALITTPVSYSANKAQEVIEIWGDDNGGNHYGGNGTTTFLSNDITPGVPGYAPVVSDYAASNPAGGYVRTVREEKGLAFFAGTPGAGNVWGHGEIRWTIASSGADLDLANGGTNTTYSWSGDGLSVNTKTTTDSPALNFFGYGTDTSNAAVALGLNFSRRRGNNVARANIAAGDYLGDITWTGKKATGFQGQTARLGGRVSPSWDGTGNQIPTELFMRTEDTSANAYDWEYGSDGDSFFPGNLTLNGSGIFTGDGGGLSNIASANVSGLGNIVTTNLDGNSANYLTGTGTWAPAGGSTSPGGFTDSVQFKNSGGTFDGDSVFTYNQTNKRLSLNGTGGSGLPVSDRSSLQINNGGLTVSQNNVDGGVASMAFSSYFSTSFIAPYTFFRARGTPGAELAVQGGDAIKNESYIVYADSGNTYYGAGTNSVNVSANDGAGNVQVNTTIQSGPGAGALNRTNGSQINLDTNFTKVTNDLIVGNDNANGGNIELNRALDGASAGLNPQGFIKKYNRVYGEFFEGSDIIATTADTPEVLAVSGILSNNNIFNTAGTYTVNVGGKYSVSLNAHLLNNSSGVNADAYFWIRKNGSDVSDSMRKINTENNWDRNLDLEFLLSLNDFDTIQIMWAVEHTSLKCQAIAANSAMPLSTEKSQEFRYETDIAVLQTELRNLSEKLDYHTQTTQAMMREFQTENNRQHNELFNRVVKLEQWRWMLIGAGVLLGSSGMLGIEKLMGIH
jgi:hypothetical protein